MGIGDQKHSVGMSMKKSYYDCVRDLFDLIVGISTPSTSYDIAGRYYKHIATTGQWFRVAGMLDYLYFSGDIFVFSDENEDGYFYIHKMYGDKFTGFMLREISPH